MGRMRPVRKIKYLFAQHSEGRIGLLKSALQIDVRLSSDGLLEDVT